MSHHSLKDRASSHPEDRDVAEIKKALATSGADKESATRSAASKYSCLSLGVNLPHFLQFSSLFDCMLLPGLNSYDSCEQGRSIRPPALPHGIETLIVCRLRSKLLHELPPVMHPVNRLLCLRCHC